MEKQANINKLKPCPICGGEVETSYLNDWRYRYHCHKCGQYFELNAPTQIAADLIYNGIIARKG